MQKASGIGGSERHLATLLPALAGRGVDIHMCVLASGDAHRFLDDLRAVGVPTTVLPAGPDFNPAAVARLAAAIGRLRPDLVHTHLIHAHTHGLVAAGLRAAPAVTTFHAAHPPFTREPFRTASQLVGRLPRRTIAISEHLSRFVVDHGLADPARVRVIHYGIESDGWQLGNTERAAARRRFGLEPEDVAVGVASRLVPEKGHADLIDAMAEACRRDTRLRLLIAGEGPLRDELEARAGAVLDPRRFRFLGFTPDIRLFLNALDVFAFPTTPDFGEGFGMAALEASAAGRPVVGTAVGPIPEVVADGESGLIVPPRSPAGLAAALVALAEDEGLRRRLGEGGARRARGVFGVDRMAERTMEVYDDVRSRQRVGRWTTS